MTRGLVTEPDGWLRVGAPALIFGMPLVFVPLQLAHLNDRFLIFKSLHLLPALLLLWLLLAGAVVGCLGLLRGRSRRAVSAGLFALAVLVWASAWLVTPDVWFMDREALATPGCTASDCSPSVWMIALALLGLTLAIAAAWKFPRECGWMCVLLAAGMTLNALYEMTQEPGGVSWQAPTPELGRFSSRGNVLVILLDALQGDMFSDILAQDEGLRQELAGFTVHSDAVAPASTTYLSLPAIHSGESYAPGSAISRFYDDAVEKKSFMTVLAHQGYRTLLLNPILERCPHDISWCGHQSSLMDSASASYGRELSLILRLGMRRSLPPALAHQIAGQWSFDFDIHGLILNGHRLLERMAREVVVDDGPPRAKFLHLLATHAPARVGANCSPDDVSVHPWDHQSLKYQAHCALKRTAAVFAAMRRAGVYDNTAIFLISDHGSGLRKPSTDPQGLDPQFHLFARLANATLAHKQPGAHAALRMSSAPVSLAELPRMVCADRCASAFAPWQGPRNFLAYDWRDALWTHDTLARVRRFAVAGPVLDMDAWRLEPGANLSARLRLGSVQADRQLGFGWAAVDKDTGRRVSGTRAQVYLSPPATAGTRAALHFRAALTDAGKGQWVTALLEGRTLCRHLLTPQMRDYACPVAASPMPAPAGGPVARIEFRFTGPLADGWQSAYSSPATFESVGLE